MRTLFIHRGRNVKSDYLGSLLAKQDFLFDYRGTHTTVMLLKAFVASLRLPAADVYVVEGGLCLWPIFFRKLFIQRPVIMMVPEPLFNWRIRSSRTNNVLKYVFSKADYLLPVSELVANDSRRYVERPYTLVHQYAVDPMVELRKLEPDYAQKGVLFSASRPLETGWTKGLDHVFEIFRLLHERDPGFHLYLIGAGMESLPLPSSVQQYADAIHREGFQNPADYVTRCPYVLLPARYDAFPISAVEACVSGQLPLLSPTTGTEEFLKMVDPTLVIDDTRPKDYAEKLLALHALPLSEKRALSARLRDKAAVYSKEHSTEEMRSAVADISRRLNLQLPFYAEHDPGTYPVHTRFLGKQHSSQDVAERIFRATTELPVIRAALSQGRILDFGCGSGEFGGILMGAGYGVFGFDPGEASVAAARQVLGETKVTAHFDEVPSGFDAITCMQVLQYVPDLSQTLDQLSTKLKPNGLLFVLKSNRRSLYRALFAPQLDFELYDMPVHPQFRLLKIAKGPSSILKKSDTMIRRLLKYPFVLLENIAWFFNIRITDTMILVYQKISHAS